MSVIVTESVAEQRAINAVRDRVSARLASGEWNVEDVAEHLGLVPDGVESLLLRSWSFEIAFRVARALGMDFASVLAEAERD